LASEKAIDEGRKPPWLLAEGFSSRNPEGRHVESRKAQRICGRSARCGPRIPLQGAAADRIGDVARCHRGAANCEGTSAAVDMQVRFSRRPLPFRIGHDRLAADLVGKAMFLGAELACGTGGSATAAQRTRWGRLSRPLPAPALPPIEPPFTQEKKQIRGWPRLMDFEQRRRARGAPCRRRSRPGKKSHQVPGAGRRAGFRAPSDGWFPANRPSTVWMQPIEIGRAG